MRATRLSRDRWGKEAFAYLAIILLLLTGTFAAYIYGLKREEEERSAEGRRLSWTRTKMDSLLMELRTTVMDVHATCLRQAEVKVLGSEGLRLHALVEQMTYVELKLLTKEKLEAANRSDTSLEWALISLTVDSRPVLGDMDGPVPETGPSGGNITESVDGGASSYAPKPESIGVNTTVVLEVLASSKGEGINLRDRLEVTTGRLSPVDLLRSRGDRFADALRTQELSRMVSYTLGTLAQTKAFMGHGRDISSPTGEMPGPVLTQEEVAACVDLSVALLARGHLGCTDVELLNRSGKALSKAPGAGGDVPGILSLVSGSDVPMDPSLIALLSEGLFSRTNPPSLERMVRPLLEAALSSLVFRFLNYTGLDDELLEAVGGFSELMRLAVEGLNAGARTLFGTEVIDRSEKAVEQVITDLLERGGLKIPEGGFMMVRGFPDRPIWEGAPLSDYPVLSLPTFSTEVNVYLTSRSDEDLIYLSKNGTKHSKAEYYDPSDKFLGYRCDMYVIHLEYDVKGVVPEFRPFDILSDNGSRAELMDWMGMPSNDDGPITEDALVDIGKRALQEGIDAVLRLLSENGEGMWRKVWTGWTMEELPPLNGELQPFSLVSILSMDSLGSLVDMLGSELERSLARLDLAGETDGHMKALGRGLADRLLESYDRLVGREGQERTAYDSALPSLLSHGEVLSKVAYLESKDIVVWDKDLVMMGESKDVIPILADDGLLLRLGMNIGDGGPGYGVLLEALGKAVSESFDTVKARELGTGSDGRMQGLVRAALTGTLLSEGSRGSFFPDMDRGSLNYRLRELINSTIGTINGRFIGGLGLFKGRVLAPSGSNISYAVPRQKGLPRDVMSLDAKMVRSNDWSASVEAVRGVRSTDPEEDLPPYVTDFEVHFNGGYQLSLRERGRGHRGHTLELWLPVELDMAVEVSSPWEMEGAAYQGTGTLLEKMTDVASDLTNYALDVILNGTGDLLGDTLGSINEVPPLVRDILSGKDIDLAEAARVLSNVTLDLSRTLRETIKGAVSKLMELGVEGSLMLALDVLGIDKLELKMDISGARLELLSYRKVLTGGNGTLLGVLLKVPSIGLKGALTITREEGAVLFFGNVTYDKGPLFIRVLLDPYMTSLPHMVSVEGVLDAARDIRFSFSCPALTEYRSLEISLKGSLGLELMVPIPILGIQAVFDAGLRVRYMQPDEISPHLNEVRFDGRNMTAVEVYDPRLLPLHGCTVELQGKDGGHIASWEVRGGPSLHKHVRLTRENLIRWTGPLPHDGALRAVLRSPSGEPMDDVAVREIRGGWLSRDRDGFGVFRWTDGTPGAPNCGGLPLSLSALIFSIAVDSLKEAYEEAMSLYPISFDMVVHLIERAIDLFVERLVTVVRELVLDIRLFIHMEVEDASGSGGLGVEMSFVAIGEAVADLMEWLYLNIKAFMSDLLSGAGSGSYVAFPLDILEECFVELLVFSQVETPVPLSKMAPPGVEVPDSLTMGVVGGFNMALPLRLLGMDVGGWSVYGGIYIMGCPSTIVSLFYDATSAGTTADLWLLRLSIREGD